MKISVTVNGSFEGLAGEIEARVEEAIGAGAAVVESSAKGMCPVDTGALQGSIAASRSGMSATVSAGMDYASYVEFGTYKMAAQPYLVPALLENESEIISAIARAISL